jgi:hypothetical protein
MLLEDDGVSEAWREAGKQLNTAVQFQSDNMRVAIGQPTGLSYDGAPSARSYTVRFHGYRAPVGMRIRGGLRLSTFADEASARKAGGGVVWDRSKRVLSVLTPPRAIVPGGTLTAVIEPSGEAFGGGTLPANPVPVQRAAPGCGCGVAPRPSFGDLLALAWGLAWLGRRRR